MTSLETRIKDDMKAAMKAGAKDELEVLRTILSDLKNEAIAAGGDRTGMDDELVLKVLRRGVKTRGESADMYRDAGRDDLEGKERFQIGVLERYLPAALSEDELATVVEAVISELGASTKKEMGAVMKEVMARTGGRADGKAVSALVGGKLS